MGVSMDTAQIVTHSNRRADTWLSEVCTYLCLGKDKADCCDCLSMNHAIINIYRNTSLYIHNSSNKLFPKFF